MKNRPLTVLILGVCPLLVAQEPQPGPGAASATHASVAGTGVPKPNTLLDGTAVKLRISRNISSADARIGEHVDFEVLEDVLVMGTVVIAKGSTASGTITDAQPKRRMGRAGKLDLTMDYVRLVDNEKAALTATAGGSGGSHTGAMVGAMAATAIFTLGGSALFLLMHGKDITIPKGTETTAYINGDMSLDMSKFAATAAVATSAPSAPAPASVAAQASLNIESTPSGADIEIDGAFVGSTPSSVTVASGSHQIAVKRKGFDNWTRTLNVTGGTVHLNADLEPSKAM